MVNTYCVKDVKSCNGSNFMIEFTISKSIIEVIMANDFWTSLKNE